MALSESVVTQICGNASDFNALVLDNPTINDQDIVQLSNILPQNSHINEISIKAHNLTHHSYSVLLDLVKSHPHITSFHCSLIKPLNAVSAMYNSAIREILAERRQEKNKIVPPLTFPSSASVTIKPLTKKSGPDYNIAPK